MLWKCKHLTKHNRTSCGPLYHTTSAGKCLLFGHVYQHPTKNKAVQTVSCGNTLDTLLRNELVVDCTASEEQVLLKLLQGNFSSCHNNSELPCMEGHSKCFTVTEICQFSLDDYGHLSPCRNGGHLENCPQFECGRRFKCKDSFCLSWTYVLDGKWDCSQGEEEQSEYMAHGREGSCVGMFKCWRKHLCIPIICVCDGVFDCPAGDDEHLCELKFITCPDKCHCLALAISCHDFKELSNLLFIFVAIHKSPNSRKILGQFPEAVFVIFHHCQLRNISDVLFPEYVISLNIAMNGIALVTKKTFKKNSKLLWLSLDRNNIVSLEENTFSCVCNLRSLNLSNNPLQEFPMLQVNVLPKLKLISVVGMIDLQLDTAQSDSVKVKVIEADNFHICCMTTTNTHCTAYFAWYRSCEDLLEEKPEKVFTKVMSLLILIVNVLCLWVHIQTTTSKAYTIVVSAINVSNIVLCVFLTTLWGADLHFGQKFAFQSSALRSSSLCFFQAGINLFHMFSSVMLTVFLAFCRFMVVAHPFDTAMKKTKPVLKYSIYFLSSSTFLSLCFSSVTSFVSGCIETELCILFADPSGKQTIVKVLVWFGFCIHPILIVAVCYLQVGMFLKTAESQQKTRTASENVNVGLVLQLCLLPVSNVLCWLSVSTMWFALMLLETYPTRLVTWTLILLQPINALMKPSVLFGFVIKSIVKERRKQQQKSCPNENMT